MPGNVSRRAVLGGGSAAAAAAAVGWSSGRPALAERPERPVRPDAPGHGRRRKLIEGGYVLTMDGDLGDLETGEVLIDGEQIVEVAPRIDRRRTAHAERIDAAGKIVMPGLIDNHRHMWESLIRGFSANHTFEEYFAQVLFGISPKLTPEDVRLGNLLGAYESLESGVTTILDWSHGLNTHDHALSAIEGLRQSGTRAVFAYSSPASNSGLPTSPPSQDDVRAAHVLLAEDPLIDLAVATSNPESSGLERVATDLGLARELGVGVTLHAFGAPEGSAPRLLDDAGLLGDDLTFIHANDFTEDDFERVAAHGAHVTSSPEVEMQMGLGAAPLARMLASGIDPSVSVDVVAAVGGDLRNQLRFLLQTQRMFDHQEAQDNGGSLPHLLISTRDVLPYATTHAAASLGLGDKVGSLTPGKQADIILVNALDLNTLLSEPSAALVESVHPGNVDTVLVGGRIVKRRGELVGVDLAPLARRARRANERLLA